MRGRGTWDLGLGAWGMGRGVIAALALGVAPLSAQQKVPLVLHHLVLDVDSVTWNDIAHSPFIRDQFAANETGYLNPPDAGTGIRLMGKYSYLQLMPSPSPAFVGIMLAAERAGGLATLRGQGAFQDARQTSVRGHGESQGVRVAELSDRIRPAGVDSASPRVGFELLQYTTDAARRRSSIDSLSEANRSNVRFFAEYFDSGKFFSHLTGATLAIPVDDIARISRVLERDGVAVTHDGEGAIIKLDGFTLHLIPPYRGAGVKQLQFALTHAAPANPNYRFGPKSQLRFGPGLIAVWDFDVK